TAFHYIGNGGIHADDSPCHHVDKEMDREAGRETMAAPASPDLYQRHRRRDSLLLLREIRHSGSPGLWPAAGGFARIPGLDQIQRHKGTKYTQKRYYQCRCSLNRCWQLFCFFSSRFRWMSTSLSST